MRGRFLGKLKLTPTLSNLKQGLVLHLNPPDIFDQDHILNNLIELDLRFNESEDDKHVELDKATSTIESKETQLTKQNPVAPTLPETKMGLNITQDCKEYPSLIDFEEICPPEGSQSVILYTTSLRGIRKTFQDCKTIHFLLRSFKVSYQERDMSLHLEYREELWKILGGKVIPPKLFIKGRYIGGADEVVGLHEMGRLGKLLEGISNDFADRPCTACANVGFTICSNCSGSCKVFTSSNGESNEFCIRCPECNENGLVKCPICC
ncbi:Thioredoxin-like fold [Senna tora]|uniref:Thioredoxin-like fold n=1 Tax=Senna tora TaxID=362788 RepID=A0A834WD10_9FABA|nr:Thioredoxin-like fold [Senna tora]